jgi:hypothetical protein
MCQMSVAHMELLSICMPEINEKTAGQAGGLSGKAYG